jgi:hypothetical protein
VTGPRDLAEALRGLLAVQPHCYCDALATCRVAHDGSVYCEEHGAAYSVRWPIYGAERRATAIAALAAWDAAVAAESAPKCGARAPRTNLGPEALCTNPLEHDGYHFNRDQIRSWR